MDGLVGIVSRFVRIVKSSTLLAYCQRETGRGLAQDDIHEDATLGVKGLEESGVVVAIDGSPLPTSPRRGGVRLRGGKVAVIVKSLVADAEAVAVVEGDTFV